MFLAFVRGIKSHSGASKRFRLLSDGTYLRQKAGRNHNFAKKGTSQRIHLRAPITTNPTQTAFIRKLSL